MSPAVLVLGGSVFGVLPLTPCCVTTSPNTQSRQTTHCSSHPLSPQTEGRPEGAGTAPASLSLSLGCQRGEAEMLETGWTRSLVGPWCSGAQGPRGQHLCRRGGWARPSEDGRALLRLGGKWGWQLRPRKGAHRWHGARDAAGDSQNRAARGRTRAQPRRRPGGPPGPHPWPYLQAFT